MLDSQLLEDYMAVHWGYGNPGAGYWFVGVEQGGGGTFDELQRRLDAWRGRGRREFEDLHEYHLAIGQDCWTRSSRPLLQSTWKQLVRTVLAANGQSATIDSVRHYQSNDLGRQGGATCLVELNPLPSPRTATWQYGQWTSLPQLRDRHTYFAQVVPDRVLRLRQLIDRYAPQIVVFYGLEQKLQWERLVEQPFVIGRVEGFQVARRGPSRCFLVRHPSRARNQLFESLGNAMRDA